MAGWYAKNYGKGNNRVCRNEYGSPHCVGTFRTLTEAKKEATRRNKDESKKPRGRFFR